MDEPLLLLLFEARYPLSWYCLSSPSLIRVSELSKGLYVCGVKLFKLRYNVQDIALLCPSPFIIHGGSRRGGYYPCRTRCRCSRCPRGWALAVVSANGGRIPLVRGVSV